MYRSLLKQTYVIVETVVRHVYEPVSLLHHAQHTVPAAVRLRSDDGFPHRILQVVASAVRESHQVLMVVIASSSLHSVELVEVKQVHHTLVQSCRHVLIVYHSERVALPAALHSLRYLLQNACPQVVANLHLRILRELESIRLKVPVSQSAEDERQTIAYHVVQIHQIFVPVTVWQPYEPSAHLHRQLYQRVVARLPALGVHLHGEVYAVVRLVGKLSGGGYPHRTHKAAQPLPEEPSHIPLLLLVELVLI